MDGGGGGDEAEDYGGGWWLSELLGVSVPGMIVIDQFSSNKSIVYDVEYKSDALLRYMEASI